ncbi:hypothetical protein DEU56DRAFT_918002 [Suillus clintonianus]|uniref:uncharacterized protein n=1 Tax=Suillus clintonianus TaxID=1904413 RepID=UPI001B860D85|nr:uncharacterized protein DEU56DRAFT_918002 [Suillus clintonianus]KAG2121920.1 hypothetical protein DEU56DRAFT_918002 [Suillus clintonianus]
MQLSLVFSILVSFVAIAVAYPTLNVGTRSCDFDHDTEDTATIGEIGFCYEPTNDHKREELESNLTTHVASMYTETPEG